MKFTFNWLKEHLETDKNYNEICEKLTNIGIEVESMENLGEGLKYFSVAKIIKAEQHPNADRLRLCEVDTGKEILQIVCGAKNARAGIKVVLAPIGVIIPNGGFEIKKSKIRGEDSNGMLCSLSELGLTNENSDGIVEIDEIWELGTPVAKVFGKDDVVIEVAITPNRGDCLGVYGIARDLSATGIGSLKEVSAVKIAGSFTSSIQVKIESKNCRKFCGYYIKNTHNKESPDWLKNRLALIGMKSISAIVDITNYISHSYNRPLHAYDADKIAGDIVVKDLALAEEFLALDGVSYKLDKDALVISDSNGRILALAGIIGGSSSSCEIGTKNIFLESAIFDSVSIAKTKRLTGIHTEAGYRFERGSDIGFVKQGLDLATKMILEICGGEVSEIVQSGGDYEANRVKFDFSDIKKLLGFDIEPIIAKNILTKLGFKIEDFGEYIEVKIPSWRNDVSCKQDLIEEIVRIFGYDKIQSQKFGYGFSQRDYSFDRVNAARKLLCSLGLYELVSWSFISKEKYELYCQKLNGIEIKNPISSECVMMRPSLLIRLIDTAKTNINIGCKNLSFFEIGHVFVADDEFESIAGVRIGLASEKSPLNDARKFDVFDVKSDIYKLLDLYKIGGVGLTGDDLPSYYHPTRSAGILQNGIVIGYFGQLHPKIGIGLDFKKDEEVNIFELFPDRIRLNTKTKTLNLSKFQPINRDFSFVFSADIKVGDIIKNLSAISPLISNVKIFDIYNMEVSKKSIAFSVEIQPQDKNLASEEIDEISGKIITSMEKNLQGVIRS